MNPRHKILPAVCCIALMSGCASNQSTSAAPWSVSPMINVKNSSDKPEAMYQIGRYYQGQNRYDQAISAYLKALNADAGFVEARNGLGVIYSKQGKYREAIEAFQIAIQQAPKAAHLYSNMGYAYYLQGQYTESVKALEQATLLEPANQRALNNLGLALAKTGNGIESTQAFSQAANVPIEVSNTSVTEVGALARNTSQSPGNSENASKAVTAKENSKSVHPSEVQMLVLPKDRGVVRFASQAISVPVVESRAKLVKLAPNVSELHVQPYSAEPMQVAAIDSSLPPEKLRVEVANGNGVTGAAGKVGKFLRDQGYSAARLTNQKPFKIQTTQIQYREGYQAEAQLLKSRLPDAPKLVQRNDMRSDISVRLVLGRDMVTQLAKYEYKGNKIQLALVSSGK